MFRFVVLPCFDLGLTVSMYSRRQKECNKHAAAALIGVAYLRCAYSSVCAALPKKVCGLGLRRFSTDCSAFPRIAALFQEL